MQEENEINPNVFISYSHDSEDYKDWVRSFSDRLTSEGIKTTLDQYDLTLGDMNPLFMEKGIAESDYVIMLITEQYAKKANARIGGAGYETNIVTGEICIHGNRKRFIPVFVKIDFDKAPEYLKGANAVKIKNLFSYDNEYESIYRVITGQTLKRPALGSIRKINTISHAQMFDIPSLITKKRVDKWVNIDFIFELSCLAECSVSEIYTGFMKYRVNRNDQIMRQANFKLPYILSDQYKKSHQSQIIFESNDYTNSTINLSTYDKLVFEENFIRYSYLEMSDHTKIMLNGQFVLGNIIFILDLINKVINDYGGQTNVYAKFSIDSNSRVEFSSKKDRLHISSTFFTMYGLSEKQKDHYNFSSLKNTEVLRFVNRFLNTFTSPTQNDPIPFLSIDIDSLDLFKSYLNKGNDYFD